MIVNVELLPVNKIENRNGSKLLGQRTQIKNRIRRYFRSGFQVRVAVAVQVYDFVALPDRHSQAREAIAVFSVCQLGPQLNETLVYDFVNSRIVRQRISIQVIKLIEGLI